MEARELQKEIRIGNWLNGRCIDDLDDRKEWWEYYQIKDGETLMSVRDDWDKPIPLSKEVLSKCSQFKIGAGLYRGNIGRFVFYTDLEFIWMYSQDSKECISIRINGLHHLQNIVHTITNEELIFNP